MSLLRLDFITIFFSSYILMFKINYIYSNFRSQVFLVAMFYIGMVFWLMISGALDQMAF